MGCLSFFAPGSQVPKQGLKSKVCGASFRQDVRENPAKLPETVAYSNGSSPRLRQVRRIEDY